MAKQPEQILEEQLVEFITSKEDLTHELYLKISNIKGLVFYLQSKGYNYLESYELLLEPASEGFARWENSVFTFSHKDIYLVYHVRSMFESFQRQLVNGE